MTISQIERGSGRVMEGTFIGKGTDISIPGLPVALAKQQMAKTMTIDRPIFIELVDLINIQLWPADLILA